MFPHFYPLFCYFFFFFFNDTAPTEIYTLSLHDALPILSTTLSSTSAKPSRSVRSPSPRKSADWSAPTFAIRSEEHTSELQSLRHLVCRLLLEKKKKKKNKNKRIKNQKNKTKIYSIYRKQ